MSRFDVSGRAAEPTCARNPGEAWMWESRSSLGAVSTLRSLSDVLNWAQAQAPPAEFVEVVGMDEFTNDVTLRPD
jgi:hypothetical protein